MDFGKLISKHRGAIMGIAAIMIICYHAHWRTGFALWNLIANEYGNMGVDFFIFVMGFGLAYSLKKDPDVYRFYVRRMTRILPAYCITLLVSAVLCFVIGQPSVESLLKGAVPLGIWLGSGEGYWYIAAMIVFYAIAPMFYMLIYKAVCPRIMMAVLMIFTGIIVPAISNAPTADIALMRVPVLVLGIGIGIFQQIHMTGRGRNLNLLIIAIVFVLGFAIRKGVLPVSVISGKQRSRLSKSLMAPMLVVLWAYVFEILSSNPLKYICKACERIGKYSLEIYLDHLIVFMLVKDYLGISGAAGVVMTVVFSWLAGILLARGSEKLLVLWKKLRIFKTEECG